MESLPPSGAAIPRLETLAVEPLMTREFETRPELVYERLRARYGPVAPVDLFGVPVWLVLGYRQVLEVLSDESRWKKGNRHWRALREGRVPDDWPMLPGYQVNHLLLQDDERRAETRAAVEAAIRPFQDPGEPQAVELAAAVERHTDELISFFAEGGGNGWVDLCGQFSRPLPLMVINRLFGFPVEQNDDIFMDAWRMVDSGPDAAEAIARLRAATTQLAAFKKENPGDDLTTRLIAAAPDLPVEQIGLELYAILVIADLINKSIANSVLEVLTGNARVRESLLVGTFSELVNRVHIASPPWGNGTHRYPVADTELGGFRLAAGDAVVPSIAAAHADPEFAGRMDDDALMSSRAHLAWAAGPHQCPFRELAEMVVTTAVSRLFERCDLELALPPDQIPWRNPFFGKGVKALPARYRIRREPRPVRPSPGGSGVVLDPAVPDTATPAAPAPPQHRSRLWRFLAGLRSGGPRAR